MSLNIAIVGTGPTGLYALAALARHATPLMITLYEKESLGGVGMPYSPVSTHVAMLANIASIEIPPLCETYLDWLHRQPEAFLAPFGACPAMLHDRQFLPRLLLGGYFRDQLECLIGRAVEAGHWAGLREGTDVVDVSPLDAGVRLSLRTSAGETVEAYHDAVILATGHSWPEGDSPDSTVFPSPWTGLPGADIPAGEIGILGSSLSGIDAALDVALRHGRFVEHGDGRLAFDLDAASAGLRITLMSRQGLLPEADFYCPLPYEPLDILTDAAVRAAVAQGQPGLLDRLFALLRAELDLADPHFSARLNLRQLDADTFAAAYFGLRQGLDPFQHAAENLAEVRENARRKVTVPWRYAILRMHEPFERAASVLSEEDLDRFDWGLKRVFIDNYAAVPTLSVERVLAMHEAGVLRIVRIGDDYRRDTRADGVTLSADGQTLAFDRLIDARGQRRMGARDLPFPTLRSLLLSGNPAPETVAIDKTFRLQVPGRDAAPIWLPAAPYLLHRRPFVQGITESAAMGETVARAILSESPGCSPDPHRNPAFGCALGGHHRAHGTTDAVADNRAAWSTWGDTS